jgi:hypothetical protein
MQLCAFAIFFGFCDPKAALNDQLFMQVMAAPVSKNHDVGCFPVLMVSTLPYKDQLESGPTRSSLSKISLTG